MCSTGLTLRIAYIGLSPKGYFDTVSFPKLEPAFKKVWGISPTLIPNYSLPPISPQLFPVLEMNCHCIQIQNQRLNDEDEDDGKQGSTFLSTEDTSGKVHEDQALCSTPERRPHPKFFISGPQQGNWRGVFLPHPAKYQPL